MRYEPEHDKVRVQPIETVRHIFLIPGFVFGTDKIHDLVFTFSFHVGSRKDNVGTVTPKGISLLFKLYPFFESDVELKHEISTGGDAVGVEGLGPIEDGFSLGDERRESLLGLFTAPEPPTPLLIHFGTRRDPINSKIKHLSRPHDPIQPINVTKYFAKHSYLVQDNNAALVVIVRTGMDYAIHIEVKCVHLPVRSQAFREAGAGGWVLVREPTKHLGNSMKGRGR
mmetsp:Transcript_25164/g.50048  ORF Transcript_25164/g.50048 Transcript_25164/m.50048 type:complete len:226 (-) Transcript_25164:52-729(-)